MQRVFLLIVVLVAAGFAFEGYTGRDIGFSTAFQLTKGAVSGGFAGGYGMATDAGRSFGGAASGVAKGVSNNMGGVFGN